MDVYLPIANLSVNGLFIVALGAVTGILSGMFGVGGGFLTTPLLIFYGVPPTVSAASAASQVTGASVSGVFAHTRRNGVDYQMGAVLVAGGILGTLIGASLFRLLQELGQIDTVINILYVLLLGSIGTIMARESIQVLRAERTGGFVLVPAMLYILGMSANVVVGTSLFQILFVTIATTMMHAMTTKAVDIVLAALLLLGSVTGAQIGAKLAQVVSPTRLRLALAVIVLLVAFRMALGLGYRPDEIYTVAPL
jgi:uncharacterized membrane protein YfcA